MGICKFIKQRMNFRLVRFEKLIYSNWFNPLLTLYLNFRSFPFHQARKFPIFVYGWPKMFSLYGKMVCVGPCMTGMIKLNYIDLYMPNNPVCSTAILNDGTIFFHGRCHIGTANKISVYGNGVLELGNDVIIMCECNISVATNVKIGAHSRISHRSQILDTNYHYVADFNNHIVQHFSKTVEIGSSCWICHSSTISLGVKLPNKTIVASHSLVNKDMSHIPEESIIGGVPAKLIRTGYRLVQNEKLTKELLTYYGDNLNTDYYPLENNVDHSICDVEE